MDIEHASFKENLPAYALGALDPDDTAALEIHLRTCEACRIELTGYAKVSRGLGAAMPGLEIASLETTFADRGW